MIEFFTIIKHIWHINYIRYIPIRYVLIEIFAIIKHRMHISYIWYRQDPWLQHGRQTEHVAPELSVCNGAVEGRRNVWCWLRPQFIETEKYDAKPTYKKFLGYRPGVAIKSITDESLESNCSIIENIPPKGVGFSDFIAIFAMSYQSFACLDLQH